MRANPLMNLTFDETASAKDYLITLILASHTFSDVRISCHQSHTYMENRARCSAARRIGQNRRNRSAKNRRIFWPRNPKHLTLSCEVKMNPWGENTQPTFKHFKNTYLEHGPAIQLSRPWCTPASLKFPRSPLSVHD